MTARRCVLVTGANGFVGQALCKALPSKGWIVRRAVRSQTLSGDFLVGDVGTDSGWHRVAEGMDCIVHLAARTHVIHDNARDPIGAYRQINVAGTVNLAKVAVSQGVRRFVFLSSIKVNGERTLERPFAENDIPVPEDAYGVSKLEAEQALWQIAKGTGLEVTILRPPLIYGPGVKANFLRLMRLAACGMPLPLASIQSRRSLIYLGNLVSVILACMESPAAAGKTYLVSDAEDVTTAELIRQIAVALGTNPRLFRFPSALLAMGAALCGRNAEWERLAQSLQIDSSRIRSELGWQQPFTMAEGLAQTALWYHSQFPLKSIT